MRQFITIARNAFMELIRQPVFLLLMTASAAFTLFLAMPYYFAFGDEPKLVKNSALAVMLLAGLFGAVVSASASLAREIRTGTALAVLSKPVSRAQFILAKYVGVALALALLTYVNLVSSLVASRMAFDAYGETDTKAVGIFALGMALAYLLGGFVNYFLRRPFVSNAVLLLTLLITLAAFIIIQFTSQTQSLGEAAHVDWRLVPAAILILFALWILAGIAIACSTRLDMIPTLSICSALFLLGLMTDYFYLKMGGTVNGGGPWWADILYSVLPNWQLFWVADALDTGRTTFQWGYVAKSGVYMTCYVGAALAIAVTLFEDRELS
jgi:ABC-type transport system involved in multi-copper enzyme maturation permease subunit